MTRNLTTVLLSSTVILLAVAAPASARTHSFEGSCAIVGNARFPDPMGLVPKQSSFEYEGAGTCQGTLDERTIPEVGAPVRFVSSGPRPVQSCEAGYDPGISWAMTLYPRDARRATIVGTAEVVDAVRAQFLLLRGQRSGIATGLNQLQGHMETLTRCAEGTLRGGTVGGQLDTVTPLVSDDRPTPQKRASSQPAARKLRLSVRPRRVRADRRTRLRFRATALSGALRRPVRGATVRFAGRRVRTDGHGRASMVVRLHRAGRRRVIAALPTGATAAATLRVIRRGAAKP
jgi:hypothetical protein